MQFPGSLPIKAESEWVGSRNPAIHIGAPLSAVRRGQNGILRDERSAANVAAAVLERDRVGVAILHRRETADDARVGGISAPPLAAEGGRGCGEAELGEEECFGKVHHVGQQHSLASSTILCRDCSGGGSFRERRFLSRIR